MKVTPVKYEDSSGCVKQMFEAVTEACRLPESETKNRLLCALADSMMLVMCPMVEVNND